MASFLGLLLHALASPFKSQARLEAEIVFLRHQLNLLRRRLPAKPRLTPADRLLFVWLYRLVPSLLNAAVIIQPDTIVRWHRAGFRSYWRWKSRSRGGRPKVAAEVSSLIRQMSLENSLWGAPRIHGELLKLGIEVAQSTVAKYMAKHRPGSGQTWKTFLRNHASGIGAMDFLVVPTINFRLLFVLVVLRHERRRLISLSVTDHPTAEWIARQITEAFPWDSAPTRLIRDRDASFGHAVTKRLAAMGIRDHPIAPRSPWQNGHAERLIGSIRRECLDHIVIFGEAHLRQVLQVYATYYNNVRTHLSLGKDAPLKVLARLAKAPGNEVGSGKFANPESSAALAANTFGWFINRCRELPPLPGMEPHEPVTLVEVEYCPRFPWRGGRHPWLDAIIETEHQLIGVESKRFEPYRDRKKTEFSSAYSRPVWGTIMKPYEAMRDALKSGKQTFAFLDAAQLVKHAFGLVTDAGRKRKAPVLVYLFAEPRSLNGHPIPQRSFSQHRKEIERFATAVKGSEVAFHSSSYLEWFKTWPAPPAPSGIHAKAVIDRFQP